MFGFGPGNCFKTAKERCFVMNEITANTTTETNTNETVSGGSGCEESHHFGGKWN